MIRSRVEWHDSGALRRRLAEVAVATKPDSRPMQRLKRDVASALVLDNEDKILDRSVDRFGRALASLAPSTLKNKRRGPGPVLAPRGVGSRFITLFRVRWERLGEGWRCVAGWVGFSSKSGFPIPLAHLHGTRTLPRRDVGGLSPKGWVVLRGLFARFADSIARKNP